MVKANLKQIGGTHYKGHQIEHWDYAWDRHFDLFQYIITKWVERWRMKGGIEDLKKARHALDKYIEKIEEGQEEPIEKVRDDIFDMDEHGGPTSSYVDQD